MDNGSKRLGAKTHLLKFRGFHLAVDFHVNLNLYQSKEEVEEICRTNVALELDRNEGAKLKNLKHTKQQILESLKFEWEPIN
jgi:hypothetical protein